MNGYNWKKALWNVAVTAGTAFAGAFYMTGSWQAGLGAAIIAVGGNQLGLHQTPPQAPSAVNVQMPIK